MKKSALTTYYAPPERDSERLVRAKAIRLLKHLLLKELTNAVPEIFIILNDKRQIVYANQATLRILGFEKTELLYGLRPGEAFQCINSSTMKAGCGTSENCQHCGVVNAILNSFKGSSDTQECRIVRKDGKALDLRIWCTPLSTGGDLNSLLIAQNIEDEKRREVLERIFFHDIINTASGLKGILNSMEDFPGEDFKALKDMMDISTDTLMEEIYAQKDLLEAENRSLETVTEKGKTASILEDVAAIYQRHETGMDKNIAIAKDSCNIEIFSDKRLLKRIIGNMTKNALEASKPGATVSLGCERQGDFIEFWAHNQGFIPRKTQLQIFQRSFSTKGAGRGVGTWSIKLLAEQYLGGQASFATSKKKGTKFKISIPINKKQK